MHLEMMWLQNCPVSLWYEIQVKLNAFTILLKNIVNFENIASILFSPKPRLEQDVWQPETKITVSRTHEN